MPAAKAASRKEQVVRKRTPTPMIRPKVQEVLAKVVREDEFPSRREIADRAGISQQTLYNHALDLVEEAESVWAKEHSPQIQPEPKRREEEILRQKNEEIARLERQLNDVTQRMTWMLKAVQQYAPKALPRITEVLLPNYRPDKESDNG
ncbi:hypothetical protein AB4Z32_20950 [Massilia sp. 2TAF26]|uniref:hypothetical protein n=1 Tax=Massilia sp. 2TAF26 TaxID=3233012 RepID=UPI003F9AD4F8